MDSNTSNVDKNAPEAKFTELSAEDIFLGGDDPFREVVLPEISKNGRPGVVYMRQLTAREVLRFSEATDQDVREKMQYELIAKSMVTKDGVRIIADDQAHRLESMPSGAFMRLFNVTMSLMGIEIGADATLKLKGTTPEGNASGEAVPDASPTT